MANERFKPVAALVGALALAWLVAWAGFGLARMSRMTAQKVVAHATSVNLSELSGDARTKAIQKLADMLNRLSPEERRRARLDGVWQSWFEEMSEVEKAG